MNRKGQSAFSVAHTLLFWAFMGIIITFIVLGTAYLLVNYKNRLAKVPEELKAEMISLRFTSNQDCFAYVDPDTQKVRTGSINLAKFTQERLDACYRTDKGSPAKDLHFRLQLADKELLSNDYSRNNDRFSLYREVVVFQGDQPPLKQLLNIYVEVR